MNRVGPATLLVILVAILLGLAGAYGVRQRLKASPPAAPAPVASKPKPKMYRVPLALIDLPAGRKIAPSDVVAVEMTREQFAARKVMGDASLNSQYVIGRYLKEPVAAKDPFPVSKLYPEGVEPSLADRLGPGQRAVSVAIQPISAVGGFARPGSRVDVVFRARPSDARDRLVPEVTFTLLAGVEVLALGGSSFPGEPTRGTLASVTLAVSPEQVRMLNVVEGKGELSLSMRGPGAEPDPAEVPDKLTLEALLGLDRKPPPAPASAAPATFTAEIYRGGKKETVTFTRTAAAPVRETAAVPVNPY